MTTALAEIACVQLDPAFGQLNANLDAARRLIGDRTPDLLVLPELMSTGYSFRDRDELRALAEPFPDGPTCAWAAAESARTGGVVVAGFAESDGDAIYNAAVVAAGGKAVHTYRKIHLFGFERDVFDPGDRAFAVCEHNELRVGTMICFDWVFPESARSLALLGADVIAHPSNLVLPQWCQRAMAIRAIENGVATATANRIGFEARSPRPELAFTGESVIYDARGHELARASVDEAELIAASVGRDASRLKEISSGNQPLHERRPDLYIP